MSYITYYAAELNSHCLAPLNRNCRRMLIRRRMPGRTVCQDGVDTERAAKNCLETQNPTIPQSPWHRPQTSTSSSCQKLAKGSAATAYPCSRRWHPCAALLHARVNPGLGLGLGTISHTEGWGFKVFQPRQIKRALLPHSFGVRGFGFRFRPAVYESSFFDKAAIPWAYPSNYVVLMVTHYDANDFSNSVLLVTLLSLSSLLASL